MYTINRRGPNDKALWYPQSTLSMVEFESLKVHKLFSVTEVTSELVEGNTTDTIVVFSVVIFLYCDLWCQMPWTGPETHLCLLKDAR